MGSAGVSIVAIPGVSDAGIAHAQVLGGARVCVVARSGIEGHMEAGGPGRVARVRCAGVAVIAGHRIPEAFPIGTGIPGSTGVRVVAGGTGQGLFEAPSGSRFAERDEAGGGCGAGALRSGAQPGGAAVVDGAEVGIVAGGPIGQCRGNALAGFRIAGGGDAGAGRLADALRTRVDAGGLGSGVSALVPAVRGRVAGVTAWGIFDPGARAQSGGHQGGEEPGRNRTGAGAIATCQAPGSGYVGCCFQRR